MRKNVMAVIMVIVLIAVAVAGAWYLSKSTTSGYGTPESLTIGKMPVESAALIYIAEDQDFFAKNGLNMTIRDYASGPAAISGMLKDEADLACASEYTVVGSVFNKENPVIIGCIDKYQTIYLIGRKDRGIENVSDLRGKRIGLVPGSISEFDLGRFLNLHGISLQEVTIVNVQPAQSADAVANGSVDAYINNKQYVDAIENVLGDNGTIWLAQSDQPVIIAILCRNGWATNHSEQINRLLESLNQAEDYVINHPAEAMAIVQKRLNCSDAFISNVWSEHQFSLSLDQSLLIAMDDEGRWMINNNLTSEKTLPDYSAFIYTKGLEEVKHEAVNIR
jgi:ABC-type nitrate/sulfonate/bicarbonate transport system substrate-binding protein